MVDFYKLDKIITVGETYEMPADRFYVIEKVGTDAASDVRLVIDGVKTGKFYADIAPLHKKSDNLLGPLDLGKLVYVIPPNKTFYAEGPSGAKVRIIGRIGVLAPGESIPPDYASRFTEQGKHYITYLEGSYSKGTDEAWSKDEEQEVISLTPKTIETYILNREVMAALSGGSFSEGQFAVRFYKNGSPLDVLTDKPGHKGVDILSMPRPPAYDTEMEPFTLKDRPIDVPGDIPFAIAVMNVSGSDLSPASGSAWSVKVTAIVEYIMKG